VSAVAAKTVLITGTSSGIGREAAWLFHRAGWNVVATVRTDPALCSPPKDSRMKVLRLDLSKPDTIDGVAKQAIKAFGTVDVLVNNAGYFQMGPLETSTMQQIREQFETNFFGLVALTKAVLPQMRRQLSGVVVNVSSLSAENAYPFASVYSASKAAVMALTEGLSIELDAMNISVKAVLPGQHATRIFTKIDAAPSLPAEYQPLLDHFVRMQGSSGGSNPEGAAQAIFTAATDGRRDRVRYFVGADAEGIPLMKRLLGVHGYFSFFRKTVLRGPGPVLRMLAPKLREKVDIDTSIFERWSRR
jgi:NAD(P)-dependent dehydrogenase (short-subunit alcohol dehydrogenase family)